MCFFLAGTGGAAVPAGINTATGKSDFSAEYAKSNRSTCRGCDSKIDKVGFKFLHLNN